MTAEVADPSQSAYTVGVVRVFLFERVDAVFHRNEFAVRILSRDACITQYFLSTLPNIIRRGPKIAKKQSERLMKGFSYPREELCLRTSKAPWRDRSGSEKISEDSQRQGFLPGPQSPFAHSRLPHNTRCVPCKRRTQAWLKTHILHLEDQTHRHSATEETLPFLRSEVSHASAASCLRSMTDMAMAAHKSLSVPSSKEDD